MSFLKRIISLTLLLTAFSGCGQSWIQFKSSDSISGHLANYAATSSLTCSSPTASLKKISTGEVVATTNVASDGSYIFSGVSVSGDAYLVSVNGCSGIALNRPVTGALVQDVTPASSLIGYLADTNSQAKLVSALKASPSDLASLIDQLASSSTPADAYNVLAASSSLSTKFASLFSVSTTVLLDAPPQIVSSAIPSTANELAAASLMVTATQWSPSYAFAYEWKIDGVSKSTTNTYAYTPTANSQGAHSITLLVGQNDGTAHVDVTKPYQTLSQTMVVANNVLPVAPSVAITTPSSTTVATRSVVVTIATGTLLANCASFSKLMISESAIAPAATDSGFSISCTSAPAQTQSYTLVSAGDGAKVLYLWALDAAGTVSAAASTYAFTLDTSSPAPLITTSLALSNQTTQAIAFTASGGLVDHYLCALDGGVDSTCTSPVSYSGLTAGSHTVSVKLVNQAGSTSLPATLTWLIDLTAPTVSITSTPPSVTNSLSAAFTYSGTDANGISAILCSLDGGAQAACQASYTLTAAGSHTLSVQSQDGAGNLSTAANSTWTIDRTGPTTTISSKPSLSTTLATADFVFGAVDTGGSTVASYQCSLDGAAYATCTTPQQFAGLSEASHTFNVRAIDAVRNVGTAASYTWTVDNTAPAVVYTVVNANAAVTVSPTLTVTVNATDSGGGVAAVRVKDASGTNCQAAYADDNWQTFTNLGGPQNFSYVTGFSNGLKQICAWAKDAAGNISVISPSTGSLGVTMDTITLDQGSPPIFTALSVTNGNSGSLKFGTTLFDAADPVKVTFTLTDDSALASQPVTIYVSTDNVTYTQIAAASVVGTSGGGTTWTTTYSGYSAVGTSFFRLKLVALDANGNTSQVRSAGLNAGKWSLFAGENDIGDGGSATAARLNLPTSDQVHARVAVNTKNEIFISTTDGVRKVDPATGNISTYLFFGTELGVPGTLASTTRIPDGSPDLYMDGDDLYLNGTDRLYRINTATNYIEFYAGGGTSVSATTATGFYFWPNSAFTMDPTTKDIYFVSPCTDGFTGTASTTMAVKIRKLTQNSIDRTASGVADFAGNCTKAAPVSGPQLSVPLENGQYIDAHSYLTYIPSLQTLYFEPYGSRLLKFVGGQMYVSTTVPASAAAGVYIASQNRIYYANGKVYYVTPTGNAAADEVAVDYIANENTCAASDCRADGKPLAQAGVATRSLFSIGGQLGLVDNTSNVATVGRLRVVDSSTTSLQTLAGTDRFTGNGSSPALARFGYITKLVYKPTTTGSFASGIYALDSGAARILSLDVAGTTLSISAGNGLSALGGSGVAYGTSGAIGLVSGSNGLNSLAVNPLGYFTFNDGTHVIDVDSAVKEQVIAGTSSPFLFNVADDTIGSGYALLGGEGSKGTVYDSAGNMYFGGFSNVLTGTLKNKIMVRMASNNAWRTVIGTTALTTSADCTTAGCAHTLSIYSSGTVGDGIGTTNLAPFDNRYAAGVGRLLFSEYNKIRYVKNPSAPSSSTLGTLTNQAGTAIAFGRVVTSFVYTYIDSTSEQIDKLYYISDNGQLYCYKVSTGADATCNNTTQLGPPAPLENANGGTLAMDAAGSLYLVNASRNIIYKYTP